MALSYVTATAGAGATNFTFDKGYIEQSDVSVYVDGVLQTITTDYIWFSATVVQFVTPMVGGEFVRMDRVTQNTTRLVDFQDAGNLTEADLDTSALQNFYLAQEAYDIYNDKTMKLDVDDDEWDGESKIIKNVLDPTSATDVATKQYADTVAAGGLSRGLQYNGNFELWQRGNSFSSASLSGINYTADRWCSDFSTETSFVAQTTGFPPSPDNLNLYSIQFTAQGGANCSIFQRIPQIDSKKLQGKNITISFWAKDATAGTPDSPLKVRLRRAGAADDWTSPELIEAISLTPSHPVLTTTWTKYTATFTALTSHNVFNGLEWSIYRASPTGADSTQVCQVRVETGTVATDFEMLPMYEELVRCQYYFEKSYPTTVAPGTANTDGNAVHQNPLTSNFCPNMRSGFRVVKRAIPDIHWYSTAAGTIDTLSWASGGDRAVSATFREGVTATGYPATSSYIPVAGEFAHAHWTADAELY